MYRRIGCLWNERIVYCKSYFWYEEFVAGCQSEVINLNFSMQLIVQQCKQWGTPSVGGPWRGVLWEMGWRKSPTGVGALNAGDRMTGSMRGSATTQTLNRANSRSSSDRPVLASTPDSLYSPFAPRPRPPGVVRPKRPVTGPCTLSVINVQPPAIIAGDGLRMYGTPVA